MKPLHIALCAFAFLAALPLYGQLNSLAKGTDYPLLEGSFADSARLSRAKSQDAYWVVCVWLTGSGEIEYSINADSVRSDVGNLDSMTASEIFSQIAAYAVARGVAMGYTLCPTSGSVTAGVTFAASVERTSTGFHACGNDLVRSTFSCTSLEGTTTILQIGCTGERGSMSGCELTCGTALLQ